VVRRTRFPRLAELRSELRVMRGAGAAFSLSSRRANASEAAVFACCSREVKTVFTGLGVRLPPSLRCVRRTLLELLKNVCTAGGFSVLFAHTTAQQGRHACATQTHRKRAQKKHPRKRELSEES
jgi:hypothetical protein